MEVDIKCAFFNGKLLARGFSDLEMTWFFYCFGTAFAPRNYSRTERHA